MHKIIALTMLITLAAFAAGLQFGRAGQPQEAMADKKTVLEVVQSSIPHETGLTPKLWLRSLRRMESS